MDLIKEILHAKPEILKSRQHSITIQDILAYDRIEDLVQDIIERKVNFLSYEGFGAIESWCSERGIPIKVTAIQRDDVIEILATRNIIAHNRCVVDERYTRAVSENKFSVGTVRYLDPDDLFAAFRLLNGIVRSSDKAACSKFQIPTNKFWPAKEQALRDSDPSDT